MARFRLLLMTAALAAGVSGCAHCDKCDDFPSPYLGQNAGLVPMPAAPYMATGAMVAPGMVESAPIPAQNARPATPPADSRGSAFTPPAEPVKVPSTPESVQTPPPPMGLDSPKDPK